MINKIVKTVISLGIDNVAKQGGDDMLKNLLRSLKTNYVERRNDDVSQLISGVQDALKKGWDYEISEITLRSETNAVKALVGQTDNAMNAVSDSCHKMQAVTSSQAVSVPTRRVTPPKVETPTERKIRTIQERMEGPKEAFIAENKAFRKLQQSHIDKFNKYVDNYATEYTKLVNMLDNTTNPQEISKLKKQIEKLTAKAEKDIRARLEKLGTLKPSEIESKIQEVKELVHTRVGNATYASATTNGTRVEAEKLISEVSQEINTYGRNMTPEQIEKVITMKLEKIEKFVSQQEKNEKHLNKLKSLLGFDSGNIAFNFGGAKLPLQLDFVPTDEIAKICGDKSPKEALKYYRTLQTKMKEAMTKLKNADSTEANGYLEIVEKKIHIPIKDAPKSKELTWLENQLKEKTQMLEAESKSKNNCLVAKV